MKRTFFGMLVSVAMTGTLVAAQNSQVPSSSQSPSSDQSQSMSRSSQTPTDITVTGCLVQGEDSDTYLLQNAKVSTSTSSSARPSSSSSSAGGSQSYPSSGASSSSSAGQSQPSAGQSSSSQSASSQSAAARGITYKLDTATGVKDIDFKSNLNHEVRVTGQLEMASNSASRPGSSSASGASSSSQSSSSSQGMADRDSKNLTTFSAKTVTKIADTCPAVS